MISKEKKKEYNKKLKELHKIKLSFEESKKKSKEKKRIGTNALGKTPGRLCKYCNEQKHFKEFRELQKGRGWKAQNGSARYPQCLVCERKASAKRYRKDPTLQVWNSLKINAKKNGFPFEITKEYLRSIIQDAPKVCPALGIPMIMSEYGKHKGKNANSPSIDKIIPELGYVEGNLIVITDMANRIKTNATPEQIIKVGEFYKKLLKKK